MKYLIGFFKTKKKMLALIIFAACIQAFGTLGVPYYAAKIIDVGIAQKNITVITSLGLQMLVAAAITAIFSLWGSYLCSDLAALAGKFIRERIFDQSQLLSLKQFNSFGTASMITRTTSDIAIIQQTIIMITQMILPTPLIAIAAVIMTAQIRPTLIYIPLIALCIFLVIVSLLFKKSSPISLSVQDRIDTVNRVVRESLTGIRVIRAFDNTQYEKDRSDQAFSAYADNVIRLNRIFAVFNPAVWTIMGLVMVTVIWFGGYLVLEGTLQIGSLSAVTEYTILMLIYFMMSAMVLVMIPRMSACLQRVDQILDTDLEILDAPNAQSKPDQTSTQKISFRDVTFTYKGAEQPILQNLNFVCEHGKTTAIIGGTGSGKSTIASLMLRLHDIQEGEILIEDENIQSITQHALRDRISYIPQKAFLFSGTVKDNLRMGNHDATLAEMQKAARIAQAHDFISSLDDGYDSVIAQAGTNFSGGQRQRLCIARALVRKASIYIFDDSFSALDFKTDAALRHALKQEMKDAAVVIIAQRISTIMDADQIIVLDAGRITAIGKHEELMQNCSVYQEIAASQLTERDEKNAGK